MSKGIQSIRDISQGTWRAICFSLSVLVLSLVSVQSNAEEKESLSFCYNHFPPYAFLNEDGDHEGVSVAITKEVTRRLNIPATFIELPWKRCLYSVENGLIDAVLDAASREEFIQGPTSYSFYKDTIWVRKDSMTRSLDDLKGLRIGLVDGYDYSKELLNLLMQSGISTEYAVDDPGNTRKLAFKRVDAIIGDLVSTAYYAKNNGLNLRVIKSPLVGDRLYVSFNQDQHKIQARFDNVLQILMNEGVVEDAYTTHLGADWAKISAGAH